MCACNSSPLMRVRRAQASDRPTMVVDIGAATIKLVSSIELKASLYAQAIIGERAWHEHLNPAWSSA